jgi:nucleoside-diphosphate-sugar epimerase
MRIFLAGANGAVGRRLVPLLIAGGHDITGTTRSPEVARKLDVAGIHPAIVDVYDAAALQRAAIAARPEAVIHQLTDLPQTLDEKELPAAYPRNARIRVEGTRNLIAGAKAAGARRFVVQSIGFAYAPRISPSCSGILQGRFPVGDPGKPSGSYAEPHPETDPLNLADPTRAVTVKSAADMERQVLTAAGLEGIVLRYGFFYGPGSWHAEPTRKPGLHIDAAAQAALLALTRGAPGIYNIADDDGVVSIAKARAELGFDPQFRL